MAKRRCLVTGGAGFIGSHLVEALVAQGEFVTVLDDLSTGNLENLAAVQEKIRVIKGDIRDFKTVQKACQKQDVVFHYAALASVAKSFAEPELNYSTNVTGSFNVLEAAKQNGCKHVVMISSSSVYHDMGDTPQEEISPIQPLSPYAFSKWTAEQLCWQYATCHHMNITVFRYFNVIGTRQDPSSPYSGVLSIFSDRAARNKPCTIYVKANLLVFNSGQTGTYNIGSGTSRNLLELTDALRKAHGNPIEVTHVAPRPGEARKTLANIYKAQVELGYYPEVSFEEGIQDVLNDAKKRFESKRTFKVIWDAATQKVETEV
jgi:UDP-glucose 4-epimerase